MRKKVAVLLLLASSVLADDFAGTFEHPQITLVLKATAGGYEGTLTVQGKAYPATAQAKDGKLGGTFTAGGTAFAFAATLDGDALKLESGGKTYTLSRKKEESNPLGGLGGDAPPTPTPTPPAQPGGTPPGGPPDPSALPPTEHPAPATVLDALRKMAPRQEDPQRLWTVLVYLAADNDLEAPGVRDLNEMEWGIPEKGVEVIALMDRAKGYSNADGDWTDTRVYRVRPDRDMEKAVSPILQRLGEVNLGDPLVLAAFVEGALTAFPSERRALVMWDHGGGWAAMAIDEDDAGGGQDKITLPELGLGLAQGLKAAGAPKLDIIGFDMCLMAQLETAAEVAPYARIMLASQALEPGAGWPWDLAVPAFTGNPDAAAVGKAIVKVYDAFYDQGKDKTTTYSCVDLDRTPAVIAALDALTQKLEPGLPQHWPMAARALFFSESYMSRSDARKGPNGVNSLDLMDIFRRLRHNVQPFPAEPEYQAFAKAYGEFVLATENNEGRRLSTGISVYAPVTGKAVSPDYARTALARRSRWPKFFGEVHGLQARDVTPPVVKGIRITDGQGNAIGAVKPMSGHQFEGTIEGKNIIWTLINDGVRDPALGGVKVNSKSYLMDDLWILRYEEEQKTAVHEADLALPQFKDGETKVRTEFDGVTLVVTNGQDKATATFDASNIDGGRTISFPALLTHPTLGDKGIIATMIVDGMYWDVISVIAKVATPDGQVQVKRLDARKLPEDLRVQPLHDLIRDNGKVDYATGGDLLWGSGLRCAVDLIPAGDYEAVLLVETMGDVSTTARYPYKVAEEPELPKWVEGWQAYKPEHMIGTWDLFVLNEKKEMIARPRSYTITKHPDRPGDFLADVKDTETPQENHQETWIVDTIGFPTIRMIILEGGKEAGMLTVPALYGIKEDSKPRILGKMIDVGGMLWVWVKRETVVSDLARLEPVETPEPEPLR